MSLQVSISAYDFVRSKEIELKTIFREEAAQESHFAPLTLRIDLTASEILKHPLLRAPPKPPAKRKADARAKQKADDAALLAHFDAIQRLPHMVSGLATAFLGSDRSAPFNSSNR